MQFMLCILDQKSTFIISSTFIIYENSGFIWLSEMKRWKNYSKVNLEVHTVFKF